jgi:hypothetical protein
VTALVTRVADLTEVRARRPEAVAEAAAARQRRPLLRDDGRLLLVAADHPGRGALGVRGEPAAMASRSDLLRRLQEALSRPGVDGVLGTADVLEDLLLLGALDDKVVIGSMNRGGLQGAVFELDDRFTAYDPATIEAMRFDGGKMLTRVDLADAATAATLEACGRAVSALAARRLLALVGPFSSRRSAGRVINDLTAEGVVRSVSVCQALGATSAYTWLKVPVVDGMERVMDATTLPTLLLGGDPVGDPDDTYATWAHALSLPSVRGLVVGRALHYQRVVDVAAAVYLAAGLVRGSRS